MSLINMMKDGSMTHLFSSSSAASIKSHKSDNLNSVLSTRDNISNLIDEIETLSKYFVFQQIFAKLFSFVLVDF